MDEEKSLIDILREIEGEDVKQREDTVSEGPSLVDIFLEQERGTSEEVAPRREEDSDADKPTQRRSLSSISANPVLGFSHNTISSEKDRPFKEIISERIKSYVDVIKSAGLTIPGQNFDVIPEETLDSKFVSDNVLDVFLGESQTPEDIEEGEERSVRTAFQEGAWVFRKGDAWIDVQKLDQAIEDDNFAPTNVGFGLIEPAAGVIRSDGLSPDVEREKVRERLKVAREKLKNASKELKNVPPSLAAENVLMHSILKGEVPLRDIIAGSIDLGASSFYHSVPALTLSIAGATGGKGGSALGAFVGSYQTEYAASHLQYLEERGIDFSTDEGIQKALDNDELLREANAYATTRALIISGVDAATAGTFASLSPYAKELDVFKRVLFESGEITAGSLSEGVGEGGAIFGGELATGATVSQAFGTLKESGADIKGEILGSGPTSVIEVVGINQAAKEAREGQLKKAKENLSSEAKEILEDVEISIKNRDEKVQGGNFGKGAPLPVPADPESTSEPTPDEASPIPEEVLVEDESQFPSTEEVEDVQPTEEPVEEENETVDAEEVPTEEPTPEVSVDESEESDSSVGRLQESGESSVRDVEENDSLSSFDLLQLADDVQSAVDPVDIFDAEGIKAAIRAETDHLSDSQLSQLIEDESLREAGVINDDTYEFLSDVLFERQESIDEQNETEQTEPGVPVEGTEVESESRDDTTVDTSPEENVEVEEETVPARRARERVELGDALFTQEVVPGRTTGDIPGVYNAPFDQKKEYTGRVRDILTDEEGRNKILASEGLEELGVTEAIGYYKGDSAPLLVFTVPEGEASQALEGEARDRVSRALLNFGLVTKQDAVAASRPIVAESTAEADLAIFEFGRVLTEEDMASIEEAAKEASLLDEAGDGVALIATPTGVMLLNFDGNNEAFQENANNVIDNADIGTAEKRAAKNDGFFFENNWTDNPNGESYRQGLGDSRGSAEATDHSEVRSQIDELNREFAERFGWDTETELQDSSQQQAPSYEPNERFLDVAVEYGEQRGLTVDREVPVSVLTQEQREAIRDKVAAQDHAPSDPQVVASYKAFIEEVVAQFDALLAKIPDLQILPWTSDEGDIYTSVTELARDIQDNNRMYYFPTKEGFGSDVSFDASENPMLEDSGRTASDGTPMLVNDVFRVIHDWYGHIATGTEFDMLGEEVAFLKHQQMFTDEALPALFAETMAQSTTVFANPDNEEVLAEFNAAFQDIREGRFEQGVSRLSAVSDQITYADQKVFALPVEEIRDIINEATGVPEEVVTTSLVSEARAELAKKRLLGGLGRASAGIDLSLIREASIYGAFVIEKGAREFGAFSRKMIDEFGTAAGVNFDKFVARLPEIFRKAHLRLSLNGKPRLLLAKTPLRITKNRKDASPTDKITLGNALENYNKLDKIYEKFVVDGKDTRLQDEDSWLNFMGHVMGQKNVLKPPYRAIAMANDPQVIVDQLSNLTPGQLAGADKGLKEVAKIREAYVNGEATVNDTMMYLLWSILSIGQSPYTSESAFILAMVDEAQYFIDKALAGKFDLDEYLDWSAEMLPGTPGGGSTSNLNMFGRNTLVKMTAPIESGRFEGQRPIDVLHEMLSDPDVSGREIRRTFYELTESPGIGHKILSFTLLMLGYQDVLVLDRVQLTNLWDVSNRQDEYMTNNIYDGYRTVSEANNEFSSGIANFVAGNLGLALYETLEDGLASSVEQAYKELGREGTMARYHWESWVLESGQEVDHDTIVAASNRDFSNVSTRQGKWNTFQYGVRFVLNGDETVFLVPDYLGGPRRVLTPEQFDQYQTNLKKFQTLSKGIVHAVDGNVEVMSVQEFRKRQLVGDPNVIEFTDDNRPIPKGFGPATEINEHGESVKRESQPWVFDDRVNQEALSDFIQLHGREITEGELNALALPASEVGERTDTGGVNEQSSDQARDQRRLIKRATVDGAQTRLFEAGQNLAMNPFWQPRQWVDMVTVGAFYIQEGALTLQDFIRDLRKDFGDFIDSFDQKDLEHLFNASRTVLRRAKTEEEIEEIALELAQEIFPERKFSERVREDERLNDRIHNLLTAQLYSPITNQRRINKIKNILVEEGLMENMDALAASAKSNRPDLELHDQVAFAELAVFLLQEDETRAHEAGDTATAEKRQRQVTDIAEALSEQGTRAGRFLQAFSIWARLNPESLFVLLKRKINAHGRKEKARNEANDFELYDATLEANGNVAGQAFDNVKEKISDILDKDQKTEASKKRKSKKTINQVKEQIESAVTIFDKQAEAHEGKTKAAFAKASKDLKDLLDTIDSLSREQIVSRLNAATGSLNGVQQEVAAEAATAEADAEIESDPDTKDTKKKQAEKKKKEETDIEKAARLLAQKIRPGITEFEDIDVVKFMVNTLFTVAKERGANNDAVRDRNSIEDLGKAIRLFEDNQEVWEEAQKRVRERYEKANDQASLAVLDEFLTSFLDEPASHKLFQAAIRQKLTDLEVKIRDIAVAHWSVADEFGLTLTEKLMDQMGLDPGLSASIARTIQDQFDEIVQDRRDSILKARLGAMHRSNQNGDRKSMVEKFFELSNLGAIGETQYNELLNEFYTPENLTKEQTDKIRELSERAQASEPGFVRASNAVDLMAYIAQQQGVSWFDIAIAYWYANVLSGMGTQLVNIFGSFQNIFLRSFAISLLQTVTGNPKALVAYYEGLKEGAKQGFQAARSTLRGRQILKADDKYTNPRTFEIVLRDPDASLPLKTIAGFGAAVGRTLTAADLFWFFTAQEGRAYLLASQYASSQAQNGVEYERFMSDKLYNTSEKVEAARKQAESDVEFLDNATEQDIQMRVFEIMHQNREEEVRHKAARFANKMVFTEEPIGITGAVAHTLTRFTSSEIDIPIKVAGREIGSIQPFRLVVPFIPVLANVISRQLDFTPIGFLRAASKTGHLGSFNVKENISAEERAEILIEALMGSAAFLLMLGLAEAGMDDDDDDPFFAIFGEGPENYQQRQQWLENGTPFSIKIGSHFISYKETNLAILFGVLGAYYDKRRWDKDFDEKNGLQQLGVALWGVPKMFLNFSFLKTISEWTEILQDDNKAPRALQPLTGFVPAVGLLRDISTFFNQGSRTDVGIMGTFLKDIPILKTYVGKEKINALGEPVKPDGWLEATPARRFVTRRTKDPVWRMMAEKNVFVPMPTGDIKPKPSGLTRSQQRKVVDAIDRLVQTGDVVNEIFSDDMEYEFLKLRGQTLKGLIEESMERGDFDEIDDEAAQDLVSDLANEATRKAKLDLLGINETVRGRSRKLNNKLRELKRETEDRARREQLEADAR